MPDMLELVSKLLNQAENAGTEAEAAVFMEKVQHLATVHSIDLARARHATIAKERARPVQRSIHIGTRGMKGLRTLTDLYLGVAQANDLKCTIAHDATVVYVVGFAEDIDISEALFASLQIQQANALAEFRKTKAWVGETVFDERTWRSKPVTWLTARLNFQLAYAARVSRRLISAKVDAEQRVELIEAQKRARPHLNESGQLTDSFADWMFDRHGIDLTEDNDTAVEMSAMLMNTERSFAGGVVGTVVSDEDGVIGMWVAEMIEQYAAEVERDQDNAGASLVLVEKMDAVDEAYEPMRRQARGTYRGGTSAGNSYAGRRAGREAGDKASLGGSTAIGGTKGAITA